MKKFVCTVCGWSIEADKQPEKCPLCGATTFNVVGEGSDKVYACEHTIASTEGLDPMVVEGLKANFAGECTEVGMYLAMSRQAERE